MRVQEVENDMQIFSSTSDKVAQGSNRWSKAEVFRFR